MTRNEEDLRAAIERCTLDRGFAHALRVVLGVARDHAKDAELTEFHASYRLCSNLIEAAATMVADL